MCSVRADITRILRSKATGRVGPSAQLAAGGINHVEVQAHERHASHAREFGWQQAFLGRRTPTQRNPARRPWQGGRSCTTRRADSYRALPRHLTSRFRLAHQRATRRTSCAKQSERSSQVLFYKTELNRLACQPGGCQAKKGARGRVAARQKGRQVFHLLDPTSARLSKGLTSVCAAPLSCHRHAQLSKRVPIRRTDRSRLRPGSCSAPARATPGRQFPRIWRPG